MNFHTKLEGEYRMVVSRNGQTIRDSDWFPNIITNIGLDTFTAGSGSFVLGFCRVGTGTSTPVASNTALDAQIANTTSSVTGATSRTSSGAPNYQSTLNYTYTFAQGAVVGNITEVGIGSATTGANLFSRALILDGSAQPTTLTLTSIDQLTVYYRVRVSPPITDGSGTVTLGGTPYAFQTRLLNASNFYSSTLALSGYPYHSSGANAHIVRSANGSQGATYAASGSGLAAITATAPLGTASGSVSNITFSAPAAYTPGSFTADSGITWGPSEGNATGGIGAISLQFGEGQFQVYFPTPIPKTNTQTLTLTFRYTWGR